MGYELKDGQGSIFKTKEKHSENSPDYKGKVKVNGEELSISLWVKESKSKEKYFSVGIRKDNPKPSGRPISIKDDDFPF